MPIDKHRHLIFVHVPKTGGTSIERMFSMHERQNLCSEMPLKSLPQVLKTPQHLTWRELTRVLPAEFCARAFKFSFVRNPWDRFVSEFAWRRSWRSSSMIQRLGCFYRNEDLESLDAFVRVLGLPREQRVHAWKGFDGHLETQRSFLVDETGAMPMDFIGRFETYERDVCGVARRLGIPLERLLCERKSDRRPDYRSYYSSYARDAVREIYHEDIEAFGYEF